MEDLSHKLMKNIGLNQISAIKSEEKEGQQISRIHEFPPFKKPWTPVGQRSCLVTKHMRRNSHLSPLVQRMINRYSSNKDEKKECQLNTKNKVTWCASNNKKCNSDLESNKNRIPKNVSAHARGRWVIQLGDASTRFLDQIWVKLCRLSKKGGLPRCNCKLKEKDSAIWVYCYMAQARQIFTVLKTEVHLQQAKFYLHGRCILQTDGVEIIEINETISDR